MTTSPQRPCGATSMTTLAMAPRRPTPAPKMVTTRKRNRRKLPNRRPKAEGGAARPPGGLSRTAAATIAVDEAIGRNWLNAAVAGVVSVRIVVAGASARNAPSGAAEVGVRNVPSAADAVDAVIEAVAATATTMGIVVNARPSAYRAIAP